jgi:hypothetical protein
MGCSMQCFSNRRWWLIHKGGTLLLPLSKIIDTDDDVCHITMCWVVIVKKWCVFVLWSPSWMKLWIGWRLTTQARRKGDQWLWGCHTTAKMPPVESRGFFDGFTSIGPCASDRPSMEGRRIPDRGCSWPNYLGYFIQCLVRSTCKYCAQV